MKILNMLALIKRKIVYYLPENILSEYIVIYLHYFINNRRFPNIKNPKDFNEKTIWRRLHERDIDYKKYVDKNKVRNFIKETIGEKYLVPLIGVYSSVEDIDYENLPGRFIFKTTHGSGGNILCLDKQKFNWSKEKKKLKEYLLTSYYRQTRENGYKNIKPRIVCEELLEDNIIDYKFFCYHGEPLYIEIDANRYTGHLRSFYHVNWDIVENAKMTYDNIPHKLKKPEKYEEMLQICRILSKDFKFVRVDLYYTKNRIYFGELTFFHTGGIEKIEPYKFCIELGHPLHLKIK